MNPKQVCAIFMAFALSGCAEVASDTIAGCGASAAQAALEELVQKNSGKLVPQIFRQDEFVGSISSVEIKRAVRTLNLTIDDARTADDKPNSSARTCKAVAKLKLPESMVESVDQMLSLAQKGNLKDWAAEYDGDLKGQSVSFDIEYEVQPTDDTKKVITETSMDQGLFKFAGAFIALQLRSPEASAQVAAAQREAAEEQAQVAAAEQEVTLATQQAEVASVEEAKVENQLARQTIGAIWSNFEPDQRQGLLDLQRAWVKRKQADCKLEAASTSIDPDQRTLAFLKCDTRITTERIQWLRSNSSSRDQRKVSDDGPWYSNASVEAANE